MAVSPETVTTVRTLETEAAASASRSCPRPSTTTAGSALPRMYSTSATASRKFSAVGTAPIVVAPYMTARKDGAFSPT